MKKLHILINPATRELLLFNDTYNAKNTKLQVSDHSLKNILAMIDMMWDETKNKKIYDKTVKPSDFFNIKETNKHPRPEDFVSWIGRIFPFVYSYAIAGELKHGDETIKAFFNSFIDNDETDKILQTKDNSNPSIRELFKVMGDPEYIDNLTYNDICGCSYNE